MKTTNYLKIIVLTLCIVVMSCGEDDPVLPPITEIALNQTALTLNVQDTNQLRVTTQIGSKTITWISDNPEIVSIDEKGVTTALRGGTTTITAQVENAKATCTVTVNPDVYVLARRINNTSILKNGEVIKDNLGFDVKDFFVTEKGIYVLTENKVFLNDEVVIDLFDNLSRNILFEAIYVDGENVYVCGSKFLSDIKGNIAVVWENGREQILTDTFSETYDIVVDNGDVYVLGRENRDKVLWKNGLVTIANINGSISPNSLFVDKGDVYLGGDLYDNDINAPRGAIWKNGQETPLGAVSAGTYITSIFVQNNDVYALGTQYFHGEEGERGNKAVFWKNGIISNVSGIDYQIGNDIAVYGDNVYTIVSNYQEEDEITSIVLFKNGQQETILGNEYITYGPFFFR